MITGVMVIGVLHMIGCLWGSLTRPNFESFSFGSRGQQRVDVYARQCMFLLVVSENRSLRDASMLGQVHVARRLQDDPCRWWPLGLRPSATLMRGGGSVKIK